MIELLIELSIAQLAVFYSAAKKIDFTADIRRRPNFRRRQLFGMQTTKTDIQ